MHTRIPVRDWFLLAISGLLLVVPLTAANRVWQEMYQGPILAELDHAETLWSEHSYTHYRLTLEHEQAAKRKCHQVIEVRAEKIVRMIEDNCYTDPMTVTSLFAMVRHDLAPDDCQLDTCDCAKPYRESPIYDKQLGYPSMILLVPVQPHAEPVDAEFWGQAPGMNRATHCAQGGMLMYETLAVTQLTRLP